MNEIKKKILLHVCCAPCSASVVKVLQSIYDISFYWYNPNIFDEEEYKKRKTSVVRYSQELNISFFQEEGFLYNYENWKKISSETCNLCYMIRLEKIVNFVKTNGFDLFTTSLLSSPYQKHDLVKRTAESLAIKYEIELFYCDFRSGFYDGKKSLRQKGYYMQKYCGCSKSYNKRFKTK